MTVAELIQLLQDQNPHAEVYIEQTNDNGPEAATQLNSTDLVVIIEGDLFT